jgi:hypothetical protein
LEIDTAAMAEINTEQTTKIADLETAKVARDAQIEVL